MLTYFCTIAEFCYIFANMFSIDSRRQNILQVQNGNPGRKQHIELKDLLIKIVNNNAWQVDVNYMDWKYDLILVGTRNEHICKFLQLNLSSTETALYRNLSIYMPYTWVVIMIIHVHAEICIPQARQRRNMYVKLIAYYLAHPSE